MNIFFCILLSAIKSTSLEFNDIIDNLKSESVFISMELIENKNLIIKTFIKCLSCDEMKSYLKKYINERQKSIGTTYNQKNFDNFVIWITQITSAMKFSQLEAIISRKLKNSNGLRKRISKRYPNNGLFFYEGRLRNICNFSNEIKEFVENKSNMNSIREFLIKSIYTFLVEKFGGNSITNNSLIDCKKDLKDKKIMNPLIDMLNRKCSSNEAIKYLNEFSDKMIEYMEKYYKRTFNKSK